MRHPLLHVDIVPRSTQYLKLNLSTNPKASEATQNFFNIAISLSYQPLPHFTMTSVLTTKKDDVMKVVDETAAAVAVAAEEKTDIDDALAVGSKRRFFPRVKHLLTREWESVS